MAKNGQTPPPVAPDLAALPPSGYKPAAGFAKTKPRRRIVTVMDPYEQELVERLSVVQGTSISGTVRHAIRIVARELGDEEPTLVELLDWLDWRDEQLEAGRDPNIMLGLHPQDGFLDPDGNRVEWQPGVLPGHGPAPDEPRALPAPDRLPAPSRAHRAAGMKDAA